MARLNIGSLAGPTNEKSTTEGPVALSHRQNNGEITRQHRSLFPGIMVYAFEPFPESYAQLVQGNTRRSIPIPSADHTRKRSRAIHDAGQREFSLTHEAASSYSGLGRVETSS